MKKLTQKQLQLLHAIEELAVKNGVPPTIEERKFMMNYLLLKS